MNASAFPSESSDPQSTQYTEFLLHCLQERLKLLKAIRSLSDSQSQAALHGDVEVTLGLLARKQSLLEELSVLQSRLQPYHMDNPEDRVWLSAERRVYCQQISEECRHLLNQAMQLEQSALDC